MTNNPMLHYKPGLTMDTPITVEMAAADWAILMAWFSGLPDETENGVKHLIYGVLGEQVAAKLYTAASIQGTKAHYAEKEAQAGHIVMQGFGNIFPGGLVPPLRAEDAETDLPPGARCENCGRIAGMPSAPCMFCLDYQP